MKKLYFFILILFISIGALAQGDFRQAQAHLTAIYFYNFSKYVEWPSEYAQGDFVIGVLDGDPALILELNKMAATKTANNGHKFVVKTYLSVTDIDKCNILFVPETSNTELPEIIRKIRGNSTLLVTESSGDASRGAAINFVIKESKKEFEINERNAEKCRLVVSSSLSALAVAKVD